MNKGQIQTTETIFAVIIIIIILMLCLVFYSQVETGNLKEKQREQRVLRLVSLAHTVSNWPELDCSVLESREYDCLDRVKLDIMSQNNYISTSKAADTFAFKYYSDLLRHSSLTVREFYSFDVLKNWSVFNNSESDSTFDYVAVPVNIYDPVTQTFTFGVLEITSYGQN
jgi:hypothetical protein